MAGPTSVVFGRKAFIDSHLNEIDEILATLASEVRRTRKGQVWDIWIRERPIHVALETKRDAIENAVWHDELLALGLMPEDVTVIAILSAGLNNSMDYELLRTLGQRIASVVNGVVGEPSN